MRVFRSVLFSGAVVFPFLLATSVMNWRSEQKDIANREKWTSPSVLSKSENVRLSENCPIHEAFAVKEYDEVILPSIRKAPPAPINEKIPVATDCNFRWISGYWQWSSSADDFVWVSGVWRNAPGEHRWIQGHWKENEDGSWVRLPGFWSRCSEIALKYLPNMPPEPISETCSFSVGSGTFWARGHWEYAGQGFEWIAGYEERMVSGFTYTPARYVWREAGEKKGYIFIPAYYDWALENRGVAFPCVEIDAKSRENFVYEPTQSLRSQEIIMSLLPYYPNYSTLFFFNTCFHPDFWASRCDFPSWWAWSDWWTLGWSDSWQLFWWWTHPDSPAPEWLAAETIQQILPASEQMVERMRYVTPPVNFTPKGFMKNSELFDAITKESGQMRPILPAEKKRLRVIFESTKPEIKNEKPAAQIKKGPSSMGEKKKIFPNYGKNGMEWGMAKEPAKLFSLAPSAKWDDLLLVAANDSTETEEGALPWSAYRNVRPPQDPTPRQGAPRPNLKPETPIELQNKGNFMNNPQPQQNPTVE